ncbi:MAG: ferritin-like domain-containing protein [Thiofilum sp.]|uniref:ferritin-like domain-containing protein n=1 Tax=Thiofilum sp. TaxID=2212733 RepID=UPI0025D4CBEE|nr:ferritin-like domain-containing protein [Thiofilum sp.]MBK8454435.1 ferritin-like domain-containing protein [Thiofilum sp.]
MKLSSIALILQSAVVAALSSTTALAAPLANANTPSTATNATTPARVAPICRTPIKRTPQKDSFTRGLPGLRAKLSTQECITLCKVLAEQKHAPTDIYKMTVSTIESFRATQCETQSFGREGNIKCDSTYTLAQFTYTDAPGCYSPLVFHRRPVRGRLTQGTTLQTPATHYVLGHYFAEMASMETAAVTAFRYLVRELEAYQAPTALIQMAREAINEEIEHAEMAGLLAQAYATSVPEVFIDDFRLRSLAEIALENAVQGCINETYAAACGYWQYATAEHEIFREIIGHISDEESKHAALSWAIHAWIMPQLTQQEQNTIRAAQSKAIAALKAVNTGDEYPLVMTALGQPSAHQCVELVNELQTSLWEPALSGKLPTTLL